MQHEATTWHRDPRTGRYISYGLRWCTCAWCGIQFERAAPEVHKQRRYFCSIAHYNLARTAQSPEEKFWQRVSKRPSGCWIWTGELIRRYGTLNLAKQRSMLAHRFSWELHYGPIPAGLKVLHTCDNPPCVNPTHLFLGTQGDNVRDMIAKGRRRTHSERWLWVIAMLLNRINELEAIANATSPHPAR